MCGTSGSRSIDSLTPNGQKCGLQNSIVPSIAVEKGVSASFATDATANDVSPAIVPKM